MSKRLDLRRARQRALREAMHRINFVYEPVDEEERGREQARDAVALLMQAADLSFPEAVQILARAAGMPGVPPAKGH